MHRKQRIALFTNFHPDIGGGAVNLRSIIVEWGDEIELTWYYLGKNGCHWPRSVCLGENLVGGALHIDLWRTPLLLRGLYYGRLGVVADKLAAGQYDGYWVVAMNEALALGNLLIKRGLGRRLHVSVQDDQFGWMWARSRRYKWMAPLFKTPMKELLRNAASVDVTSDGMQEYYHRIAGVESMVVHPYVEASKFRPQDDVAVSKSDEMQVGHIGSVYDLGDFRIFLRAARSWALAKNNKFRLVLIGFGGSHQKLFAEIPPHEVQLIPSLPEADAVKILRRCDFVYAMYPFKHQAALFRKTSLPTKLSTYIQAQRPIFAHTPLGSSLAEIVTKFQLGRVVSSLDSTAIVDALNGFERLDIAQKHLVCGETVYGWHNVALLLNALRNLSQESR